MDVTYERGFWRIKDKVLIPEKPERVSWHKSNTCSNLSENFNRHWESSIVMVVDNWKFRQTLIEAVIDFTLKTSDDQLIKGFFHSILD